MPEMPKWLSAALAEAEPITSAALANAAVLKAAIAEATSGDAVMIKGVKVAEDLVTFGEAVFAAVHANTSAVK
ncbi:MAG TPA: hypothetical protein VHW66_18910 [Stellaceae bacterium]|jgi:hypothetical protein|nr:hypothetical protein [Stellaceae bacterium]